MHVPLPDEIPDEDDSRRRITKKRPASTSGPEVIQLPDDLTDDASSNHADEVLLPDMVLKNCCAKGCIFKDAVLTAQRDWDCRGPTSEDIKGEMFRQVAAAATGASEAMSSGATHLARPYKYFNIPVCRSAFQHLWKLSNCKLDTLANHAIAGRSEPPHDLRSARPVREQRSASLVADKFWLHMYCNVAESLAESTVSTRDEMDPLFGHDAPPAGADVIEDFVVADDGSTGLSASETSLKPDMHPRHLPPVTWEEVNVLFDDWLEKLPPSALDRKRGTTCSFTTIKRLYTAHWFAKLPFRRDSQHKKCDHCVEFKLWRRKVSAGSEEAKRLKNAYIKHIEDQMKDRTVDARIAATAEKNAKSTSSPIRQSDDILNFTIDAMEQAKFKVPRHDGLNSKTNSGFWRPQLHVTGSVVDGVKEFWFLSDCTLPKNANTQITMVSTILQRSFEVLQGRRKNFPAVLRCVSDNATGETKNQIMCKFLAWLVFKRKVKSAELAQFRVGHTHNRQDQRFAVCGTAIVKPSTHMEDPLETIDDFATVIEQKVVGGE